MVWEVFKTCDERTSYAKEKLIKGVIKMNQKLYPLGTIVYLEEGTKKIMIIGRGAVMHDDNLEEDVMYDYVGCLYPQGINPEDGLFFNHNNIDQVIFEGYQDEEEERFLQVYDEWVTETNYPKNDI